MEDSFGVPVDAMSPTATGVGKVGLFWSTDQETGIPAKLTEDRCRDRSDDPNEVKVGHSRT
jgi:hypothetical protein